MHAQLIIKVLVKKGIDFEESSIRAVLDFAARIDLEIKQLDMKTSFLYIDLKNEMYIEQPEGLQKKDKTDVICKIKKKLYRLKQVS